MGLRGLILLPCSSFVEQYLGGRFDIEMQCIEAKEEPATKTTENFLQLTCFISPEVKYMHSGLRSVNKFNVSYIQSECA